MAGSFAEYNPLDYSNLTRNCVEELMRRGPFKIPLDHDFVGAGVYALFYKGNEKLYSKIRSNDASWPIYVGKAVPPGGRKGGAGTGAFRALLARVTEHTKSIEASLNLNVDDFTCRYLVVTPLWITMAERFLIEHYRPVWNVCMEGFGNHDPGSGRHQGEITWWDTLHPGRPWAQKLRQTRTIKDAQDRLNAFLKVYKKVPLQAALAYKKTDDNLVDDVGEPDEGTD
jgi:hypothetical protein